MSRLVLNAYSTGDAAVKLWPTALDQAAFRAAMNNPASPEGFEDSLIAQARRAAVQPPRRSPTRCGQPECREQAQDS